MAAEPPRPALVVGGDRLEQLGEPLARLCAPRRQVLARDSVRRRLIAGEDVPRDRLAVHLVRAVVDPRGALDHGASATATSAGDR